MFIESYAVMLGQPHPNPNLNHNHNPDLILLWTKYRLEKYEPGQVIFEENSKLDQAASVYVIISGTVDTYREKGFSTEMGPDGMPNLHPNTNPNTKGVSTEMGPDGMPRKAEDGSKRGSRRKKGLPSQTLTLTLTLSLF